MAVTVTHAKVSAIADDPTASAAGEVLPSDWNAGHTVTGLATVAGTGAYSDLSGTPTIPVVSDVAYDATSWNANADAPSKNAVRDKIETLQPLDATLTALAAYNTNGMLAQTAADTFAGRTLTAPAAGITIANPAGTAGNPTFALANDLAAVEGLASTGLARRTGTDAWSVGTAVSFAEIASGTILKLLTDDTDFYVSATGSDGNDGLTVPTAWATIQYAADFLTQGYDFGGFNARINVGDGTFAGYEVFGTIPNGTLSIHGSGSTNIDCTIAPFGLNLEQSGSVELNELNFVGSGITDYAIYTYGTQTNVFLHSGVHFTNVGFCVWADGQSSININIGGMSVTGNVDTVFTATGGAAVADNGGYTLTFVGTPAFATSFVNVNTGAGYLAAGAVTFSGAVTGKRFAASLNGTIDTFGLGLTYFPGSVAGTCDASSAYDGAFTSNWTVGSDGALTLPSTLSIATPLATASGGLGNRSGANWALHALCGGI